MSGKNNTIILLIAAMFLTIVSCIGSTDQPKTNPNQPNPPASEDEALTCNGWRLRLYKVTSSSSNGWIYFQGYIALENVNASYDFDSNVLWHADLQMTTTEGYTYGDPQMVLTGSGWWVPKGFRFSGDRNSPLRINIRAAEGSTGHIIKTPCGVLDYDHPETNLAFPTDAPISSFPGVGNQMTLSDGSLLSIIGTDVCINHPAARCITYTFTNANKGYAYYNESLRSSCLYASAIRPDGSIIVPGLCPGAGPGKTINADIYFGELEPGTLLAFYDGSSVWIINPYK